MKTNLFKRIFAFVLALSVITIPSLSFAADAETNAQTILENIDFSSITEADMETIYEIDASKMTGGTYTIEQLANSGANVSNVTITDSTTNNIQYVVDDVNDIVTIKNVNDGGALEKWITPTEEIVDGCVAFDYSIDKDNSVYTGSGKSFQVFVLEGPAGSSSRAYPGGTLTSNGYMIADVNETNGNRLTYMDGSSAKAYYNLRTLIMRKDTNSDWIVGTYDMSGATPKLVLATTLDGTTYSSIKVYMSYYVGSGTSDQGKIALKKYNATRISMDVFKTKAILPEANTIGLVDPTLNISFSGAVNPATLSGITFAAADGVNMVKSVTAASDNMSATVELNSLTDGTAYTLTVPATVTDADGNALAAATKTITADSDLDYIYDIDAANMTEGTYTVATLASAGATFAGATLTTSSSSSFDPISYVVSNDATAGKVITFKKSTATTKKAYDQTITFTDPIVTGAVEFEYYLNSRLSSNNGNPQTNSSYQAFVLQSGSNSAYLAGTYAPFNGNIYSCINFGSNYASQRLPFVDGETSYAVSGAEWYKLRTVVMREDTSSNWTVKTYDDAVSTVSPIFTTTLAAASYPQLEKVYSSAYVTASDPEMFKMVFGKFSAKKISMDSFKTQAILPSADTVGIASPYLTISFTEAINPNTLSGITFKGTDGVNKVKAVNAAQDNLSATVLLSSLVDGAEYTLSVPASVLDANGKAIAAASKVITGDADLDIIFEINASKMTAGTHTLADLAAAGADIENVTITDGTPDLQYRVEDGIAYLEETTQNGGAIEQWITFKNAITEGCVAFDYSIDKSNSSLINNRSFQVLVLKNGSNLAYPATLGSDGGMYASINEKTAGTEFISGMRKFDNGPGVVTLRTVVMRDSAASDWRVRTYDMSTGTPELICTTTLSKDTFDKIEAVYTSHYTGSSSTKTNLAIKNFSASNIPFEAVNAIETMKVEDAEGNIITNLLNGGDITCVVDVNNVGGKLYAAIYSDGWKLLNIKSVTPTKMGEVEIPFTNVAADASQHMKLFYWDNGFKPLTGYMDPLARR